MGAADKSACTGGRHPAGCLTVDFHAAAIQFEIHGVKIGIANGDETETVIVCVLYSAVLLFQATEMIQYWFQSKLLSKYTSIISLCAYCLVSLYKFFMMIAGKSIYWFALSNVFDYLLISVGLFFTYKKICMQPLAFSFTMAKELLAKSKF